MVRQLSLRAVASMRRDTNNRRERLFKQFGVSTPFTITTASSAGGSQPMGLLQMRSGLAATTLFGMVVIATADAGGTKPSLGLGRTPTKAEVVACDTAISPDGKELPPGQGTAKQGAQLYTQKCAFCHGATGKEGHDALLVSGQGSLATANPVETIGSFWPYATTIYDYVWRAMPFYAPGSLAPDEVYGLTAYLLYLNGIIGENDAINAQTLPQIRMPNCDGFRPDPASDRCVSR